MLEVFPGNLEIASELLVPDTVQRTAAAPFCVSCFIEILEIFKSWSETPGYRRELRMEIGSGALIPGADLLTDVATSDHRADTRPKFCRDPGPVFDGEVADTAAGIEHLWLRESTGGTGFETRRAGAAMFG